MREASRRAKTDRCAQRRLTRERREAAERVINQIVQLTLASNQRTDRPTFVVDPIDDRYGQVLNWVWVTWSSSASPDLGFVRIGDRWEPRPEQEQTERNPEEFR